MKSNFQPHTIGIQCIQVVCAAILFHL